MTLGSKSDKWCATVLKLMTSYHGPLSCAELSKVSGLKMMQVEQALKILRWQRKVDYIVTRYNHRMWSVILEQKVFD